jgi:hypothetical protein
MNADSDPRDMVKTNFFNKEIKFVVAQLGGCGGSVG